MKKIYMTFGTPDFLHKFQEENPNETMIQMLGEDTALLVHETEGETLFNQPRKYEVFDGSGQLTENGFFVFNNIPVSDEGRPVFEHRFKNRAGLIEEEPGFIAIRVLRPVDSDTYVVLTQWDDEQSFKDWQTSQSYNKAHAKRGTSEGIDHQKSIFPRSSFVTKYVGQTEH
ncbi:antibiotic biosynthesis monooxygenase family protein [Jeotgalibacillus haloalkalitolerans]|uniref:Antibiotic biosynthesis monooxygenase n=1 Tax=Jeotgalibacillus haloalkalitolerans TaxID=3104292 RepID=A0ABU5KPF9_9BACL|nr:antibiotic biosynthesis monooxygenase [Jeotgalibacillus sp. HH7-29]MDZ5713065.1 antibiotic biosynthesis monooxygenase [Jeotgalibacillus sp. HH7-29]